MEISMNNERKCLECPAFYECDRDNVAATGGGWHKKEIDGKPVTCCRPGESIKKGRKMQRYSFYCLATRSGKKIGSKADWPGRTPKWCPLGREVERAEDGK